MDLQIHYNQNPVFHYDNSTNHMTITLFHVPHMLSGIWETGNPEVPYKHCLSVNQECFQGSQPNGPCNEGL